MPIILVVLFGLGKKATLLILFIFMVGSFSFAYLFSTFVDRDFSFYSPFTRFWELLVGSLVASLESKYGRLKTHKFGQIASIFGISLIAYGVLFLDKDTTHPGLLTIVPVVGVGFIILCCTEVNSVGRVLSLKPIAALGLISYSLYLWHFPIFAFYRNTYSEPVF